MPYSKTVNYRRTIGGMHFHVLGRGPALLLCNGIGASTETWGEFAGNLAHTHTVIMFDAPGCGRSPAHWFPWTMRALADDVLAAVRKLGFPTVDVLGYSFGGALAQEIAVRAPGTIDRLILTSTTPGPSGVLAPPHVLALATTPLRYFSQTFASLAAPHLYGGNGGKLHSVAPSMRGYSHQMLAIGSWQGARPGVETLILHGDDDRITPVGNARILGDRIPGARIHIQPGEGHLWLLTDAVRTAALVNDFLNPQPAALAA